MQSVVKHFPCLLTVDTEHCEVILNFEIHNTYLYFKRKTCRCLFNKTFLYCIVLWSLFYIVPLSGSTVAPHVHTRRSRFCKKNISLTMQPCHIVIPVPSQVVYVLKSDVKIGSYFKTKSNGPCLRLVCGEPLGTYLPD